MDGGGTGAAVLPLQVTAAAVAWMLVIVSVLLPGGSSWAGTGAAILAVSITAIVWLELRRRREELAFRRALSEKLTHDLRTALTHVQSYNEMMLLGQERSSEERQRWLEVVGREARSLTSANQKPPCLMRKIK